MEIVDQILFHLWEGFSNVENRVIVLPKGLVPEVLKELHDGPTGGHLGIQKTLSKVRQRFFWYGLRKYVTQWCMACDVCASRKGPQKKAKLALKQYNVGAPLERMGIDIMGPLPRSTNGNKYILTIVDYFTKWIAALPLRNQEATTVANKLVEKFVSIFGVPKQIHSDQGTNFQSKVFREVCEILGSEKTRTTAFRPQSNGLAENANKTIQAMLSKFVSLNQKDWDTYLPVVTMAYNSSVHVSTGFTPSMLMYGREMELPIDLAIGNPENYSKNTVTEYASLLAKRLETIHEIARNHISIASESQKRLYDRRLCQHSYAVGDMVWLYKPQVKPGLSAKLTRRWTGPYVVLKKINDVVYKIQQGVRFKSKVVHHDRLKR